MHGIYHLFYFASQLTHWQINITPAVPPSIQCLMRLKFALQLTSDETAKDKIKWNQNMKYNVFGFLKLISN